MDTAFNILVIILSIFLGIFLILGITVLIYVYKFTKAARKFGEKAELTVESAKGFAEGLKKSFAPNVAMKLLEKVVKNFSKRSKVKVKK
jgi:hypothetical protein